MLFQTLETYVLPAKTLFVVSYCNTKAYVADILCKLVGYSGSD